MMPMCITRPINLSFSLGVTTSQDQSEQACVFFKDVGPCIFISVRAKLSELRKTQERSQGLTNVDPLLSATPTLSPRYTQGSCYSETQSGSASVADDRHLRLLKPEQLEIKQREHIVSMRTYSREFAARKQLWTRRELIPGAVNHTPMRTFLMMMKQHVLPRLQTIKVRNARAGRRHLQVSVLLCCITRNRKQAPNHKENTLNLTA